MKKQEKNLIQNGELSSDFDDLKDERDPKREGKLIKVRRVVFALVMIFAMIYFSGLREYFFFTRTPDDVTLNEMERVVDVNFVNLPISVFLVQDSRFESSRNRESIDSLIQNSSNIMSQAGINLFIDEFRLVSFSNREVSNLIGGDFNLLTKGEGINLILVKNLGELNGLAYPNQNTVIIPDYLAGRDYRTLAHEIGHVLGLGHNEDPRYVMYQGSYGVLFSEEEVIKMRKIFDEKF